LAAGRKHDVTPTAGSSAKVLDEERIQAAPVTRGWSLGERRGLHCWFWLFYMKGLAALGQRRVSSLRCGLRAKGLSASRDHQ